MNEFVTIDRTHPDFIKYLTGEFSTEHCALPVRSLNVNSDIEKVTFQVVKQSDILRPSNLVIFSQVLRLDLLTLTMTPAVIIACLNWSQLSLTTAALSLLVLFLLHGAVFCRNDYLDHMKGADRLNEKGGSRVIQRGWMKAVSVRRMYLVLMTLALVLAVPLFFKMPELLILASTVAVLGIFGYSHLRWARGHWLLGDASIWLCLGPLLTGGMSWVLTRDFDLSALLIGAYFGTLALGYVEIRHMISMVVDENASLVTLPTRLGFDQAKIFIIALFVLSGLIAVWSGEAMVMLVGLNFWLALKTFQVASPLSSKLYEMPRRVLLIHFMSGILFLGQYFLFRS